MQTLLYQKNPLSADFSGQARGFALQWGLYAKGGGMMFGWVEQALAASAEPDYRRFAASLLPGVDNLMGVRLPQLRRLAARIARQDWQGYLAQPVGPSFEHVMLRGLVIAAAPGELDQMAPYIRAFWPLIDNWSVCDSFCSALKLARRDPEGMWALCQQALADPKPFTARFGVVMLLFYYLQPERLEMVFAALAEVDTGAYYVSMAVAWCLSACYVVDAARTEAFLLGGLVDGPTQYRAARKILESNRVAAEQKARVRAWPFARKNKRGGGL